MDIKKSIKLALAHRDINQAELAKKMGISAAYLSQMINGQKNPTLRFVAHVAQVLDYEVSELIAMGETPREDTAA